MDSGTKLNQFAAAYQTDFIYGRDDVIMTWQYARRLVAGMSDRSNIDLLSLGLGRGNVANYLFNELNSILSSYTVLEGSPEMIKIFKENSNVANNIDIIPTFFEEYEGNRKFDFIDMGFILEHVDDPGFIVRKFRDRLNTDGRIFISVPNARSLHRLIGHSAGLLDDMYKLSEYDLQLGHQRLFDLQSVKELVHSSGLQVIRAEGLLLKPVTTAQMDTLNLSEDIMKALCEVGKAYPDICNAVLVEASL